MRQGRPLPARNGGNQNAFTTRDYTGYYQQIPSERLEDVMKLESDRFARNQWADEEFVKELEVVKEERRLRTEDSPRALLLACPGVRELQWEQGRWTLSVDGLTATSAAVLQALQQHGYTLRQLASSRMTLEDVFLQLTGRQLRD